MARTKAGLMAGLTRVSCLGACLVGSFLGAAGSVENELDRVEARIPALKADVDKSHKISKFTVGGWMGFGFDLLYEGLSPLDVTNRVHVRNQNLYGGFSLHYEPNRSLAFNSAFNLGSTANGGNWTWFGMNTGDLKISTYVKTRAGEFSIQLGGPWWDASTPLTFSSPGYGSGSGNGDERAEGGRGLKGFQVVGNNLPWGLWATVNIGKLDGAGAMSYVHYARVDKDFFNRQLKIGLAYSHLLDNPAGKSKLTKVNYNYAAYFKGTLFKFMRYYLEGALSHLDVDDVYNWDINKNLDFREIDGWGLIGSLSGGFSRVLFLKGFSFNFQPYYIPPGFAGDTSGVINAYRRNIAKETNYTEFQNPTPQEVTLFNNRYGGSMKLTFNIWNLNFQSRLGLTRNIKPTGPEVSFDHGLDGSEWDLLFGQLGHWYSAEGMSGRYWARTNQNEVNKANLYTWGGGAGESVKLLDTVWRPRYFSIFAVNVNFDIFKSIPAFRKAVLKYSLSYRSTDDEFNYLPMKYVSRSLIWNSRHDLNLYFAVTTKINMSLSCGIDTHKGKRTNPVIDQVQKSWGVWVEYIYAGNLNFHLSFKEFYHRDQARPRNSFHGFTGNCSMSTYF